MSAAAAGVAWVVFAAGADVRVAEWAAAGEGGLLAERQLQTRVDQRRVAADGGAVVGVDLLPAAADVVLVGDLGEIVTGPHRVRPRRDGLLGGGSRGRGLLDMLRDGGGRGRGVGARGSHQRQRERCATGSGHGDGAGETQGLGTAVLTLRGHDDFLSGACGVSCRVRAGDARPRCCAAVPLACSGVRTGTEPVGPPLLPCTGEFADSGRRQDWASVRIEAERKRHESASTTVRGFRALAFLDPWWNCRHPPWNDDLPGLSTSPELRAG